MTSLPITARDDVQHTKAVFKQEVQKYLSDDVIVRESCPLKWWGKNHLCFPGIAAIAQALLTAPATSVSTEWLFSKASDVITKKRNSRAHAKVIFLIQNMRMMTKMEAKDNADDYDECQITS